MCWRRRRGWCSTSWARRPGHRSPTATDAELIDLVTAELGADWPRLVARCSTPEKPWSSTTAGPVPVRIW
ncbi:fatty-acid synthase domain protein [Mycobacterium xenopi 4042]|uniref:Fatty-acid synthase domain protein n=1 Tax=Mycobacterium xenopi 4042 TaxID=1299334 RepID=X8E5E7_MYCXE|nr:fatty-acid synthase domain protein [Mycobacterium xenopi 4042]